jgi:hypothetical protein
MFDDPLCAGFLLLSVMLKFGVPEKVLATLQVLYASLEHILENLTEVEPGGASFLVGYCGAYDLIGDFETIQRATRFAFIHSQLERLQGFLGLGENGLAVLGLLAHDLGRNDGTEQKS